MLDCNVSVDNKSNICIFVHDDVHYFLYTYVTLSHTCTSLPGANHKMELTKKELKEACRRDKLYTTPYLNDRLYLHYKVRRGARLKVRFQLWAFGPMHLTRLLYT